MKPDRDDACTGDGAALVPRHILRIQIPQAAQRGSDTQVSALSRRDGQVKTAYEADCWNRAPGLHLVDTHQVQDEGRVVQLGVLDCPVSQCLCQHRNVSWCRSTAAPNDASAFCHPLPSFILEASQAEGCVLLPAPHPSIPGFPRVGVCYELPLTFPPPASET